MATEKMTATAAMREVLAAAGKPLPVKEIIERTLAKPGVALKGKTPGATIAAKLAVSNKDGGEFKRTAKGVYGLRAGAKAEPKAEAKDEGDEFSPDLKEAAAAADRKAAKPHPKPTAKREKATA